MQAENEENGIIQLCLFCRKLDVKDFFYEEKSE